METMMKSIMKIVLEIDLSQRGRFIAWLLLFACILGVGCGNAPKSPGANHDPFPKSDDRKVGGPCDRCDEMYIGMPAANLIGESATLAKPEEPGERLTVHGQVFAKDGKTVAADVLLYFYHTDAQGFYSAAAGEAKRSLHGHLRGWVRTDANGQFSIQTIRPAPYPKAKNPAHIHGLVKEAGLSLYYIDDILFADDTLLTDDERQKLEHRGGELITTPSRDADGKWNVDVTIFLGRNIPEY
jgi:protocatechuate 3,4-dioxygenase, beta subunit